MSSQAPALPSPALPSPALPSPAPSSPALSISALTVTYSNSHRVLDEVELEIQPGECLAIVGESGCGKTTLAGAMLGLLPARTAIAGSILLAGRELLGLRRRELRPLLGTAIGYVAQDPYAACDPLRTVRHHVQEAWRAKSQKPNEDDIFGKLCDLGIEDVPARIRNHPHQWSGGMLQRATIVAATAHRPVITVADEPTSALDAELADDVLAALRRSSPTLLLISHDLRLVDGHADRVAVLRDGKIIEVGPTADVLRHPKRGYTRTLLMASTAVRTPRLLPSGQVASTAPERAVVVASERVGRTYRSGTKPVRAVEEISMSVAGGEVLGLVGASGSGKSTLLRLLAGIERPDAGKVYYTADAISVPPPKYVMPIFQDPVASLDSRWPIWRTVTEPLASRTRMPRQERISRARAALAQVKLGHLDPLALPSQLSIGQCQRVAVARALIAQPALIVADEPTANLDVCTAAEIVALLRMAADLGSALIIVSHDEPLLASVADRIVRIADGRLIPDRHHVTDAGPGGPVPGRGRADVGVAKSSCYRVLSD